MNKNSRLQSKSKALKIERKQKGTRNPFRDVSNNSNSNNNSGSHASTSSTKGCLGRFFLSHSSSPSPSCSNISNTNSSTKTHLNTLQTTTLPSTKLHSSSKHTNFKTNNPSLDAAPNITPLTKVVVVKDAQKSNNTDSSSGTSNTKTPPVQASVSPEIQCGYSMTTSPATHYAAGHVVSGVTDNRKCRPRGLLTVREPEPLPTFDSDDEDDDDDDESQHRRVSNVSVLPKPAEASVQWLLSPCNEDDDDFKENSRNGLRRLHNSPASPSCSHNGFSSHLCHNISTTSVYTAACTCGRRRIAPLISPIELPDPRELLRSPPGGNLVVSSLVEDKMSGYDHDTHNTPCSINSLGSENLIQTPESNSDRRVKMSWLDVDGGENTHNFYSELDSVSERLQMASLSSKTNASLTDPNSLSFQFECLTTPSNSIDLSLFQKTLVCQNSWFSNSSLEKVSQSQMRISWREGLVSRILEMDEFDTCRCFSDEEDDTDRRNNLCPKSQSHQRSELNVDVASDRISPKGFGSMEFLDVGHKIDDEAGGGLLSQVSCSCAESISTDGGGLVRSEDSDWTECYKNQLFQE